MAEIDPKQIILERFRSHVKGKAPEAGVNPKHCGKEGHWLEKQMGIQHNSNNEPDIMGYEMKHESAKITLGDFSASEYLFSASKPTLAETNGWAADTVPHMTRTDFIRTFGAPNPKKAGRHSWSGRPVPIYGSWNEFGQKLTISESGDIQIFYSFSQDKRPEEKKSTFPAYLHKDDILIAVWRRSKMEPHINKKFNSKGFFLCRKTDGLYNKICFGRPFQFEDFLAALKRRSVIFDSGMYEGNSRNYSQFRGSASGFWRELIVEELE